jgi:hypothetical protein
MTRKLLRPEDYRYDPFQDALQDVAITNEEHVIESNSPYTVRLDELPKRESPSSMSVRLKAELGEDLDASETDVDLASSTQAGWFTAGDVITVDSEKMLVSAVSGATLTVTRGYSGTTAATHAAETAVYGKTFEEVAADPSQGQFWPDYTTEADGDENWNTGTLKFNSADAGKKVAVSYRGMGALVDGRALGLRCQVFTASGTFVVPPKVYTVYVTMCGGGGGGGRGVGYYGGGGAQCWIKQPVNVTPGDSIPVTVGAGGTGKTSSDGNGTAGGASSFGSLLSASGGASASGAPGGPGGVYGEVNDYAQHQWSTDPNKYHTVSRAGAGGGCALGAGGTGAMYIALNSTSSAYACAGRPGGNYGGGGGGAIAANAANGAPGIVIVEW